MCPELVKISDIPLFSVTAECLKVPLGPLGESLLGKLLNMEILESQTHAEPIFVGSC